MHVWRAAHAAPSPRVTLLAINGRRVRFLLAMLAALMFTMHLFGVHIGHGEDAAQPTGDQPHHSYATSHATSDGPSAEQAADLMPGQQGDGAPDGAAAVEPAHDDPTCGEAFPSRDVIPTGVLCPALSVLWHLEPLARTYPPLKGPEPPHRTPSLVHELGVQRV